MSFYTRQIEQIKELLRNKDWLNLRRKLAEIPAPDLVDLLLTFPKPDRVMLFRLLPHSEASEVFATLSKHDRDDLLWALTEEETRRLLAELAPDDRTDILEEMPGEATQKLLNLLSEEDLKQTRFLLGYPPDSVGGLMTPRYVAVRPDWTVERAFADFREKAATSETISTIYVVDNNWKLLDALDLTVFVLAKPHQRVEELMDYQYQALSAFDDRERAVELMRRYDLNVLPVVDSQGTLVGIVTFDDVIEVAEEEATEDFHKSAAISPLRQGYLQTGAFEIFRRRITWLVTLVFVNIFSGAAIAQIEGTIAAVVALVFFLPLIIDSSGNAGSQAATLVIRGLALKDIKLSIGLACCSRTSAFR